MGIRIGSNPSVSTVRSPQTTSAPAVSQPRATSVDSFADSGEPTQAEVDAKYNSMTPQERKDLYEKMKNGDSSLSALDQKVGAKIALRKGILSDFENMTEEQEAQLEKALNKMNHG